MARQRIADGNTELPLNALAREAGVGVGTVYRHFPTPQALLEAASLDSFAVLVERTRAAVAEPDPAVGLRSLILFALERQLHDPAFACVLASSGLGTELATLGAELGRLVENLLARAHRSKTLRTDVDAPTLQRLVCGLHHAVVAGQRTPGDLDLFVDVVMLGLRPVGA